MRTYPGAPIVGIGVVLLRGAQVLLVRRGKPPGAGTWSLPGGGQELGERAEDCARRELLEETGLTAGPLTLIAHVDLIQRDAQGRIEYHYTILDFGGRYVAGEARAGDDVTALAWADVDALEDYALTEAACAVIARAVSVLPP